jgi:hypothetical protein
MLFLSKVLGMMYGNFERGKKKDFSSSFDHSIYDLYIIDYLFTKEYFINNHIDLALCDHFGDSCIEAASSLNIPYIVTTSIDLTKGKNHLIASITKFAYLVWLY